EKERDGKKVFVTTQDMELKVLRDGTVVTLRMGAGCEELADGTILAVSATQYLGSMKVTLYGKVERDKLIIHAGDGKELKRLPWDDTAIGLYAQERIWKDKKVEPGDRLRFTNFELMLEKALLARGVVGQREETDVLEVKKDDPKAKA